MPRCRKTLGSAKTPQLLELKKLISSYPKVQVADWAIKYSEEWILPIYCKYYPNDERLNETLEAARAYLAGKIKFIEVKHIILNIGHAAAREAEAIPAAQAAARACAQAASSIHVATHALALAFYGSAARAYDEIGHEAQVIDYERYFIRECKALESSLTGLIVDNDDAN